ncbi:MAG: hypothetical protein Q7W05_00900 [Deltaproteobacteria bacterium]|nr:hypothetical protein [Deltaproteobacteria bacterium]
MTELVYYIKQFAHLRRAPNAVFTEATKKQAPHKPILLLAVREALLRSCFSDEARTMLEEQAGINAEAFSYSVELEQKAHLPLVLETLEMDSYKVAARYQGFRRAVVSKQCFKDSYKHYA